MNNIKRTLLLFFFISSATAWGQTTRIHGKVIDALTKEPISFVNILFRQTDIGTVTDNHGVFSIETKNPQDSLVCTIVGYRSKPVAVKKNSYQELLIELQPIFTDLNEITVVPGENPANILFKKILENKKKNNPEKINQYQCELYNKVEIDISNFDTTYQDNPLFEKLAVVFKYIDTSAVTGRSFLPIFLSESVSDYYFKRSPKTEREVIKATQSSGIDNPSISRFLGNMYLKINIYDNLINVFGRNYVSPLSNLGLLYYKYKLVDTAVINNHYCYQLTFKPRFNGEPTFEGNCWVNDSSFALVKFEMKLSDKANINFVNNLVLSHEYTKENDSLWLLKKEVLFIDFNITDHKTLGSYGRKTSMFKNYRFNTTTDSITFSHFGAQKTKVLDSAYNKPVAYWSKARQEELTPKEKLTFTMVDSLKRIPLFQNYVNVAKMFFTGYLKLGYFEYGPVVSLLSWNGIEGERFRFGGRTSVKLSKTFQYEGYLAYGTKDCTFKYGLGVLYLIHKDPRQFIKFTYKDDLRQLGQSFNAYGEDNFFGSFLRHGPSNKLLWMKEAKVLYEKEWFRGLTTYLQITQRNIASSHYVPIAIKDNNGDTVSLSEVNVTEVRFRTHISFDEKFIYNDFDRLSLGSHYPIINFEAARGIKFNGLGDYDYTKLVLNIRQTVRMGLFGHTQYVFEMGKTWGKIPFLLLDMPSGNQTYYNDPNAFNLMNYFEFVNDRYVSVMLTHHFDGFFFNKIPLMKKLKLRELFTAKSVWGNLSNEAKSYAVLPTGTQSLSKPYVEIGPGIENIARLFRIDALWRLSYLDNKDIAPFGFRIGVSVDF